VWGAASLLELLALLGQAMAVGVVVTVVATILPAIRAAKMPPAAALRVEV
jgi:ABC-type antimicrobial peptide transport system permease subunit